jgi:hypothetical protein
MECDPRKVKLKPILPETLRRSDCHCLNLKRPCTVGFDMYANRLHYLQSRFQPSIVKSNPNRLLIVDAQTDPNSKVVPETTMEAISSFSRQIVGRFA